MVLESFLVLSFSKMRVIIYLFCVHIIRVSCVKYSLLVLSAIQKLPNRCKKKCIQFNVLDHKIMLIKEIAYEWRNFVYEFVRFIYLCVLLKGFPISLHKG